METTDAASLTLTIYEDVAGFLSDTREHLEASEAENGLLLGLLTRLAENSPAEAPFMARAHVDEHTLGVAYLSGLNLIVSRGMQRAAERLVRALLERGHDVPGIVGPDADVETLIAEWSRASGCQPSGEVQQMLYELRAVEWPTGIPGRMRAMTEADVGLVTPWVQAFHHEALPNESFTVEAAQENARARPAQGLTYIWEVEGAPVAMAALSRPTRRGITINAVYTPPEHRRQGYASALVAALSQEGLGRGKAFCVLYADLANPTSNAIYQKIGYRPVSRTKRVRFEGAPDRDRPRAEARRKS